MKQLITMLQALAELLGLDFLELWKLVRGALVADRWKGMYEVLECKALLELCDIQGDVAICHKSERVRFLQDNVIAFQDLAWGDGEIFADYQCSPGVEADRYEEGHRWRVLISLRETKSRGSVEEFRIRRVIRGGFTRRQEAFQVEVNHKTRELAMGVVFPAARYPKRVTLLEQNSNRSRALGSDYLIRLPDGRLQANWSTDRPSLFEAYVLQWEW